MVFAIINQQLTLLTHMVDADGNVCGYNETVKDYPVLAMMIQPDIDILSADKPLPDGLVSVVIRTTGVCAKECPND